MAIAFVKQEKSEDEASNFWGSNCNFYVLIYLKNFGGPDNKFIYFRIFTFQTHTKKMKNSQNSFFYNIALCSLLSSFTLRKNKSREQRAQEIKQVNNFDLVSLVSHWFVLACFLFCVCFYFISWSTNITQALPSSIILEYCKRTVI